MGVVAGEAPQRPHRRLRMRRRHIAHLPVVSVGQLAQQPGSRAAVLRHPQIGPLPSPRTQRHTSQSPSRRPGVGGDQIQHLRRPIVLIDQFLEHLGPGRRIRRNRHRPEPLIAVSSQPRPERLGQLRDPMNIPTERLPATPMRHIPRRPTRARQQTPQQVSVQPRRQRIPQPARQHLLVHAHAHKRHRRHQIPGHPNPPHLLGPLQRRDHRQSPVQPPQIPRLDNTSVKRRSQSPQPCPGAALAPQRLQQPHLGVVVHHPVTPAPRQHTAHGTDRTPPGDAPGRSPPAPPSAVPEGIAFPDFLHMQIIRAGCDTDGADHRNPTRAAGASYCR